MSSFLCRGTELKQPETNNSSIKKEKLLSGSFCCRSMRKKQDAHNKSPLTYKPVDAIWKSLHLEDHRGGKIACDANQGRVNKYCIVGNERVQTHVKNND